MTQQSIVAGEWGRVEGYGCRGARKCVVRGIFSLYILFMMGGGGCESGVMGWLYTALYLYICVSSGCVII